MLIIILASLLAIAAFIILTRLLWTSERVSKKRKIIPIATIVLIGGLLMLTASGRLHWIVAAATAILPFLRAAAVPLLRFALQAFRWIPLLRVLRSHLGKDQRSKREQTQYQQRTGNTLSKEEALQILGLSAHPSREEIILAHRKIIQKLHPDRGGSNYLAQQVNEAKRILLD